MARVVIIVGALGIAGVLTVVLRQYIALTPFVFFYGAVAVAAAYAGVAGGALATLAAVVAVDYYFLRPTQTFALRDVQDIVAVLVFVAVSTVVTALAVWMRGARHTAEDQAERLGARTLELETRQHEMEVLAADLEQTNVELKAAMDDANIARNAGRSSEERLRLLDESSRVLASSLDYETTIAAVARLAVPAFADWCVVDIVEDGEIKQIAMAHRDPEKAERARELTRRYPPSPDSPTGVAAVIRDGESQFIATVTDKMLESGAQNAEHLAMLREVGICSIMIVPMAARSQTFGTLTLVSSHQDRQFDESALAVASDLGRRAAVAIDSARLYRAALVANEAKANFLATMSHELRTPLAAVIGYEELLAEGIVGAVNDVQRQQLERIKASAMHLLSLIDEILLFARVEAGREEVRIEPVVAKGVVDDAIAFVAPSIKNRRDLIIVADAIDPALVLQTDAGKLRQILLNLVANAVKFTPHGRITVRARPRDGRIDFEVQDTGIGISRENQKLIFDPFWQVTQSTTRAAGGSGLGLSVTRRLTELLGGVIAVESEPGVGTTFRVTLPESPTGNKPRSSEPARRTG